MTPKAPAEPFPLDQIARWSELRFQYPQAGYKVDGDGWYYSALRDEDVVVRGSSLERLIDALVKRG